MGIYVSSRMLKGNRCLGKNGLPKFRDRRHDKELVGVNLLDEERKWYGYETGDRVLPYQYQDVFSRRREDACIKTIIMENDHVRAEFWPEYGMRLMSLYQKDDGRELLFQNSVLQFSNLAIRRAWFSGGIEWNIGQLGHTFTTCDNLFAIRMEDGCGEFLRCCEYERCKGLYWYIDFHLGKDDRFLTCYVRIVNPKKEKVPFYWWTNIAVREEDGMRVFSGTDEVIYIEASSLSKENAAKGMAHGRLPYLPIKEGVDYSYPENFTDYSNEYFFQNRSDGSQTWEAAGYNDGWVFFTRATKRLRYHKMFCWGWGNGGRHWRDFLSEKGKGDYVELQGGFAPTQVHGMDMPGGAVWDFVQVFGGFRIDAGAIGGCYSKARETVYGGVDGIFTDEYLETQRSCYAGQQDAHVLEYLHLGSGYGALEGIRDERITPPGFHFPASSIGKEEEVWLSLLLNGVFPELPDGCLPSSYMVDMRWEKYLLKASSNNSTALNMLGVMYRENALYDKARLYFEKALAIRDNAFSYRNLAVLAKEEGDEEEALSLMSSCVHITERREYAEEYVDMLIDYGRWIEAWDYYNGLKEETRMDERLRISMMSVAAKLGKTSFLEEQFSYDFAVIREGERHFSEIYFTFQALKEAERSGVSMSDELVAKYRKENRIPFDLDFRLG